ncbi:MAG: polyprenyl synthetase family protein [Candidatus Aphodosoma sp.]
MDQEIKQIVKDYFEKINWPGEPHNLYDPIDYALQSGGKRLRPVLVLMAVKLFGGDINAAVRQAAAMEVFHNFTLLHDDVMDSADMRRGRPAVRKKWNDNTAILSGDAMLIRAYQMLEDTPADKLQAVLAHFSKTAIEVCEGQQYDADFEYREDVTIEEYFEMIRLKTAVLLAGCLKMGAILAGASESDTRALYDFGIAIGIAFQLRDDYLDCYGDERTFGKKIGGDILCGKSTFLLIETLKRCSVSQTLTIRQLLKNHSIGNDEKVAAIIDIYTRMEMPRICEETMKLYYNKAIEALGRLSVTEEARQPFVDMARTLTGRNE